MKNLIPTVSISLEGNGYEVLECTVNPVFFISHPLILPWPKRKFVVWVELVLGHHNDSALPLPRVIFKFNSFYFSKDRLPPVSDIAEQQIAPENHRLYDHFWHPQPLPGLFPGEYDLLQKAYNETSVRVIPLDCHVMGEKVVQHLKEVQSILKVEPERRQVQAALAFTRMPYSGRVPYNRLNYPCTFLGRRQNLSPSCMEVTVSLSPFSLRDEMPIGGPFTIHKEESISVWYYYPYDVIPSAHDPDERKDLLTFYHIIKINAAMYVNQPEGQVSNLNCFPRLPFRYEIRKSEPAMVSSPRFPVDPPVWCKDVSLYPVKLEDKALSPESPWSGLNPELMLFIEMVDTRMDNRRDLIALLFPLIGSLIFSIIVEFNRTFALLFAIESIFPYVILFLWLYEPAILRKYWPTVFKLLEGLENRRTR